MLFIISFICLLVYVCYVVADVFSSAYFNDPISPETLMGHAAILVGLSLITLAFTF